MTVPTLRRWLCALLAGAILTACGTSGETAEDSGTDLDAGAALDAGDSGDAGATDSGVADSGPLDGGQGPALYPPGLTHSPITEAIAANLRRIAANGPALEPAVFAKVGDSNTVNSSYLGCLAGSNVNLAGRTQLQPTLDFFRAGNAGGATPYNRVSLAATVGWSAWSALAGSPSPLTQESNAIHPRIATVMFGSNDVQSQDIYRYAGNLFDIADQLIARGTVPIFSSIPPRDDSASADAWVPRYNAVARAVAQARQFPFVDLHRELLPLPSHGLGPDGLHLNVYFPSAGVRGCDFGAPGLQYGHNTRNLLTLTALDRARGAIDGNPAPDLSAPALHGAGTLADPLLIESLPFTDVRDTSKAGANRLSAYSGCASPADESGPEFLYRLTLTQATNLRAFVVSLRGADIDLHLLGPAADAESCQARDDKLLTRSVQPGTYYLSLDTYVAAGTVKAGEYLLVVLAEP